YQTVGRGPAARSGAVLAPAARGQAPKPRPLERGPRVGLTARGDVAVAGDVDDRIAPSQCLRQARERRVLPRRIRNVVGAFELDADREIVAALAAPPRRH